MREVFHITCIGIALRIVRDRYFQHAHAAELDMGMNLFDSRPGYTRENDIPHTGAKLILEWHGEELKTGVSGIPSEKNTLHDQHGWRMFIPAPLPASAKLLKAKRIDQERQLRIMRTYGCTEQNAKVVSFKCSSGTLTTNPRCERQAKTI